MGDVLPRSKGGVIRIRELATLLGIGRSTVYDWMNAKSPRYDPTFPIKIQLGKGSVGWLLDEVLLWLSIRAKNRSCGVIYKEVGSKSE